MTHGQTTPQDLEMFQRWAIAVDDQLLEAVDAVMALEDPEVAPLFREDSLSSDRPSADLANEVLEEAQGFRENPDRPAWFTPAYQMVLAVSTRAQFLMDYVDDVTKQGSVAPDYKTLGVLHDKVAPALKHLARFLDAVRAAGHLSTS
jgi:hypothetical protein